MASLLDSGSGNMSEKQFRIIDEEFISYYGGYGYLISDGDCKFWLWQTKEESQKVCDKLNKLIDENEELKYNLSAHMVDLNNYQGKCSRLEEENGQLKKENEELNSIKRFAENNGINIFKIDEAFRRCWNDNGKLINENEQLKSEIQQYKALLQDMGLLMSDNEVNDIRNDIADKFLKPLFKMNGFDVDINTDDGFTIIPKGDDGVWVKNK